MHFSNDSISEASFHPRCVKLRGISGTHMHTLTADRLQCSRPVAPVGSMPNAPNKLEQQVSPPPCRNRFMLGRYKYQKDRYMIKQIFLNCFFVPNFPALMWLTVSLGELYRLQHVKKRTDVRHELRWPTILWPNRKPQTCVNCHIIFMNIPSNDEQTLRSNLFGSRESLWLGKTPAARW